MLFLFGVKVDLINEFLDELVEIFVECSNFAFCILRESLRVHDAFASLAVVDNDTVESDLHTIFKLLFLMLASQVFGVWLLAPHLQKQCSAMVLKCGEIRINVDVRLDKLLKDGPCRFNAF